MCNADISIAEIGDSVFLFGQPGLYFEAVKLSSGKWIIESSFDDDEGVEVKFDRRSGTYTTDQIKEMVKKKKKIATGVPLEKEEIEFLETLFETKCG